MPILIDYTMYMTNQELREQLEANLSVGNIDAPIDIYLLTKLEALGLTGVVSIADIRAR